MSKQSNFPHTAGKACLSALLAAGMALAGQSAAQAVEFQAKGQWLVGFALGDASLIKKNHTHDPLNDEDKFGASQRFRLQLDAVASESLSGTLYFEIGDQAWGRASYADGTPSGGALGADGMVVKVKGAWIDWMAPGIDLKTRMGIQPIALPNAAGGSAVLDSDVAAVAANWQINEYAGLTFAWMRPLNDNFAGWTRTATPQQRHEAGFLDNMDLFALSVPLTFDGVKLTPWVMYGFLGKYALNGISRDGAAGGVEDHFLHTGAGKSYNQPGWKTADGSLLDSLTSYYDEMTDVNDSPLGPSGKSSFSMFWAGLPVVIDLWDPLHIELDFNYGFVESIGSYTVAKYGERSNRHVRASSQRQGWLAKALVEYRFDWGAPGVLAWYASGDDGDLKNGSERMPSIRGKGSFTSFTGYGGLDWGVKPGMCEWRSDYSGTWGVGLQLRDVSFLEGLSHTFRAVLQGGTNSVSMVSYMEGRTAWNEGGVENPYLTTNDYLLEFNLDSTYRMYENFAVHLDLGYVVNLVSKSTWNRRWMEDDPLSYSKKDAWKVQVAFEYTF